MDKYMRWQDLSVGYNGKALIHDINIDISKGEIIVLIGPNGSGKSTILKTITRQLSYIAGTVTLEKDDLHKYSYRDLSSKMAVVLTERMKPELMTCFDIVATGRYPYTNHFGTLTEEDEEKVYEAMKAVHAVEIGNRDFAALSDGQRQRVLLARAICQEPEIMILDEPTSFLDIKHKLELLTILRDMARKNGITVVMSLHEIGLAEKIADKVICVKGDTIYKYGKPEEIFTEEIIRDLYDIEVGDEFFDSLFGAAEIPRFHKKKPAGNAGKEPDISAEPGKFEHYVRSGNKNLRMGYTTGTCAALASGGAARYALSGDVPAEISIMTVKGIPVTLEPHDSRTGCIVGTGDGTAFETDGNPDTFSVSVIKDAGDDADATNGIEVWSSVTLTESPGIEIDGGFGVGRVTKPGLDQPVGNAAINSTPRRMIRQMVEEALEEYGWEGGAKVIISIPEGIETAKKTFNPMLGIEGGISVIGTSGIVEPMSEQALIDTIEVTLRQALEDSKDVILTPGNYGERFLMKEQFDRYGIPVVKCSNFLGEALDCAAVQGAETVLLVGHIGKLSKVAAGVMNTHSKYADARREVFTAHAVLAGADKTLCEALMGASTTDACLSLLEEAGLKDAVMERILKEIQAHLAHRVKDAYRIGAVVFSNEHGLLGMTDEARTIIGEWDRAHTA